jgi:hypothetical protein
MFLGMGRFWKTGRCPVGTNQVVDLGGEDLGKGIADDHDLEAFSRVSRQQSPRELRITSPCTPLIG